MQVTPFFKAVNDAMPTLLGIQSYTMSLVRLAIYLPMESYQVGEAVGAKTPARGHTFNSIDYERALNKHRLEGLADGFNIAGATAFLYFSHPWNLVTGYLLWTGYYIASGEARKLKAGDSQLELKDRGWVLLYGFGAITCIACAIFSHGKIPYPAAIAAARIFATSLSSIETTLFFYNLFLKIFYISQVSAQHIHTFVTPRK